MSKHLHIGVSRQIWQCILFCIAAGTPSFVFASAVDVCVNDATGIMRVPTATKPCMTGHSNPFLRESVLSLSTGSAASPSQVFFRTGTDGTGQLTDVATVVSHVVVPEGRYVDIEASVAPIWKRVDGEPTKGEGGDVTCSLRGEFQLFQRTVNGSVRFHLGGYSGTTLPAFAPTTEQRFELSCRISKASSDPLIVQTGLADVFIRVTRVEPQP